MMRWYLYAAFGVLAGAMAFVILLNSDAGFPILLALGAIAATVEIVVTQRQPRAHPRPRLRLVLSAILVFALVVGLAFLVFLLLYVANVAP